VHDDFETKYELMMMVKQVEMLFVVVHTVMDIDFEHKFDLNTKFANQITFVVAKKKEIYI